MYIVNSCLQKIQNPYDMVKGLSIFSFVLFCSLFYVHAQLGFTSKHFTLSLTLCTRRENCQACVCFVSLKGFDELHHLSNQTCTKLYLVHKTPCFLKDREVFFFFVCILNSTQIGSISTTQTCNILVIKEQPYCCYQGLFFLKPTHTH